jgi:predicted RNase H-like HicB family nuclease
MKFTVTIDRDESGTWVAECPAIPGCVSQGTTKTAALKNVREAIELCLELTIETKQVEVAV